MKGKIVFKGHPANRPDLVADFDTLLKGEEITGKGTANEEQPAENNEGQEKETKRIDMNEAMKFIDNFVEVGTEM